MQGRSTGSQWERVVMSCLFLAGCQSHESAAREQFAEKYSCPAERLTVTPREDVPWSTISARAEPGAPPEEVKKDPARLAKWEADRQKEKDAWTKAADDYVVFEVEGCDHKMFAGCRRPAKSSDGKPNCYFEAPPKK